MTGIHSALQAIGYGLLVLFFAVGVMKTCGSFVEVKKPEHALKLFIRFALAKGAVTYGLELMLAVFSIVQGMVSTIITQSGSSGMSSVTLPQELIDAINNVGFWDSIPLWAVTLIGGLLITVLSFTMILTVYGRMFSLWMYAAIAPIPLSTFAGEPTSSVGKNFIRSYAGVCLQGVVIALSCIIFSAISSSPPAVDTGASVVTAVWTYVGELAFNLLVLVGAIKGCDRIVKEKAAHHYGAQQILRLMIENPFQQIRCLCTTACNLQNNVNQFFLRVVKFNSVNCQKNQHNVGADALVAIHEWVIAD